MRVEQAAASNGDRFAGVSPTAYDHRRDAAEAAEAVAGFGLAQDCDVTTGAGAGAGVGVVVCERAGTRRIIPVTGS